MGARDQMKNVEETCNIYGKVYDGVISPFHVGTINEYTCKAYHHKLLLSLKEKCRKERNDLLCAKNKTAPWGVAMIYRWNYQGLASP